MEHPDDLTLNPNVSGMRAPKHVVRALLAHHGTIQLREHQLIEDADGWPLAVEATTITGQLVALRPEHFGYTKQELQDDHDNQEDGTDG